MVTTEKKKDLNKEEIFKTLTEYDIYRFYLGDFIIGEPFNNPIRGEHHPSMKISVSDSGKLIHLDYGDSYYRGDCFDLVMQMYNCDYNTALKKIDKDFNLEIISSPGERLKKVIHWKQPVEEELAPKFPPKLTVIPRKPNKEELDYWSKLSQGEEDLKRGEIYFPAKIFRNGKRLPILKNMLIFAYYYPGINKWKLYRPFGRKKNKKLPPELWKWDSSVPYNYIEGLSDLSSPGNLFLTTSRKDKLVLSKVLETYKICVVQSEDPATIGESSMEVILKSVDKEKYIVGNNDKKGKEFSWWLTKEYNFKHINPEDKYLEEDPIKTDFSDLVYYYGIQLVKNYFNFKGIVK